MLLVVATGLVFPNYAWAADWYDADWHYRKEITVADSSDAYQTRILVSVSDAAIGEDVDCESHCQADLDDLRFTEDDGTTLVPYYVEEIVVSGGVNMATVWVRNSTPACNTLYMYYGNAVCANTSSGADTFIKFEDFEWGNNGDSVGTDGGSIDWTVDQGTCQISTEQDFDGSIGDTRSLKFVGGAPYPQCRFDYAGDTGYAIRLRVYKENAVTDARYFWQGDGTYTPLVRADVDGDIEYYTAGYNDTGFNITEDAWCLEEINDMHWDAGAHTYDIYQLDPLDGKIKDDAVMRTSALLPDRVGFLSGDTTVGHDMWIDNIMIRKWNATEQTFSAFGAEEEPPAPTVVTLLWSGVGKTWAILYGEVTASATAITDYGFDYGTTDAYGDTELSGEGVALNTPFWLTLRDLDPATVYHFRAVAINAAAGTGYGEDMTFSTIGSPILYEYLNDGGDADGDEIYADRYAAQSFTVGAVSHTTTSCRLLIKRDGTPSTITVELTHATGDEPTGEPLATATLDGDTISVAYTWYSFVWDNEVNLEAGEQYAIVVYAKGGDAANSVYWYWDTGAGEANGKACLSTDAGITWVTDAGDDYLFEIWGNPALTILNARVIKNYIETNDWLIVATVQNTYEPYYSDYADASQYFRLQLLTGADVVKGVVPWVDYGRKPLAIYLAPDVTATLTWGDPNYKVRAYLSATEYAEYNLTATDWLPSVYALDGWVLQTARDLEDYYDETLLVNLGDKGMVLNDTGGAVFSSGVANLQTIRPNLFQTSKSVVGAGDRTFTAIEPDYNTQLGAYYATQVNNIAAAFGIDPQEMLGWFIMVIWLIAGLVVLGKTQGIAGLIATSPIIVVGYLIGGLDFRILFGAFGLLLIFIWYKLWAQNAG